MASSTAEVSKYRDNSANNPQIALRGTKASLAALVEKNKFIKQSEDENRINCQVSIYLKSIRGALDLSNEREGKYFMQIVRGPMKSELKQIFFPKENQKTVKIAVNHNYEFATTIFRVAGQDGFQVKNLTIKLLKSSAEEDDPLKTISIAETSFDLAQYIGCQSTSLNCMFTNNLIAECQLKVTKKSSTKDASVPAKEPPRIIIEESQTPQLPKRLSSSRESRGKKEKLSVF